MKSITYLSPHKTALTLSLVLAASSLLILVPMMIFFTAIPFPDHNGEPVNANIPITMAIIMPIGYFILGYIGTGIAALLYNLVAKFTGGIAYESDA